MLIPRSMVFPSPSAIGSQKIPATSGKTGSNADSAAFPGLHEIEDDGLRHAPGRQRLIGCRDIGAGNRNAQSARLALNDWSTTHRNVGDQHAVGGTLRSTLRNRPSSQAGRTLPPICAANSSARAPISAAPNGAFCCVPNAARGPLWPSRAAARPPAASSDTRGHTTLALSQEAAQSRRSATASGCPPHRSAGSAVRRGIGRRGRRRGRIGGTSGNCGRGSWASRQGVSRAAARGGAAGRRSW